jgi:hypothetical protein
MVGPTVRYKGEAPEPPRNNRGPFDQMTRLGFFNETLDTWRNVLEMIKQSYNVYPTAKDKNSIQGITKAIEFLERERDIICGYARGELSLRDIINALPRVEKAREDAVKKGQEGSGPDSKT